jgi:hypothetical protein
MRGLYRRTLAWLGALLLIGCSGNSFTSAPKDGGGGTSGNAGSAGTGGTGGSAGADGGGPCNPSKADSCSGASYCKSDTLKCTPCTDLSRIRFGTAEPLELLNQSADGQTSGIDLDFPRSVGTGKLFYVTSTGLNQNSIYYTDDLGTTPGALVTVQGANTDSRPLHFAQPQSFGGQNFDFVFDEVPTGGTVAGHTHLYSGMLATVDGGPPEVSGTELPAPLNAQNQDSFSIALATGPTRVWWMMGPTVSYNLYTARPTDQTAKQVHLTVLPGNCDASFLFDATPWATPDGSVLFFRSLEQDGQCHIQFSTATDLYYARIDVNGAVTAAATPLTDVNQSNTVDTDPSLSPDLCWLYFASNRESAQAHLRLYRAHRD